MRKVVNYLLCSVVVLVTAGHTALAQASGPRIIFNDLQSGPNTGGVNNKGAIVSVYGFGFGASRGASTITIGGAAADNYLQWSDTKVSFQIGNSAVTGNIVVNVPGAGASNGMPFTVRSGRLRFVSTLGSDSNSGTFSQPWRSILHAKNAARRGDIIYVRDGVVEAGLDSASATLAISMSGTASQPIAIVAYPGANVTIGSATGQQYGIRTTSTANNWVIAGISLRGVFSALTVSGSSNWRVVGNDISCPNGSGTGACVTFSAVQNAFFYRNFVHDNGSTTSTSLKLYQAVQFEEGSNNIDVGWNEIANTRSCRALQFYSDTTALYNLTVRNNRVHDSRCDAINFATVDPVAGAVKAYGNVIYRAGTGPAPGGIESSYTCIRVGGTGSAPVQVTSNTLYDCGRRANGDSGGIAASVPVTLVDNIFDALSGESYVAPNTSTTWLSGNNNLFFGNGLAPSYLSSSVSADPKFVAAVSANFQLQSSSPAIDAGVDTGIARDIIQTARPQGAAFDIGAYEYAGAVVTPPPPPPPPQQGTITVAPSSLAFGNVTVGTSATQTVTLSNSSSAAVTISSLAASGTGFTRGAMPMPMSLSPGQSANVSVTFTPPATGSDSGNLQISSNATNGSVAVPLAGTGTTAPPTQGTLTVSPSSLAFGSVTIGTSSQQTVNVSNSSTVAVIISGVTASGAGFSQSGMTLPLTLSPGQSGTITVTFAPQTSGSASGTLNVASNATNGSVNVALSGAGGTVQHTVDLSWNASTSSVAGYNVYRATQSSGPFTKINSALVTALTFTDKTVSSGATYFYVVTAVAADGTESAFSSQTTAVVPNP
jgi:hypothetical protein